MQDIKKMHLFAQKHPHILYQGRRIPVRTDRSLLLLRRAGG